MSETDRFESRSNRLLSSALSDLARSSPHSASETTRKSLAREFQRYHRRRRAIRVTALLAIALVVFGGLLGLHNLRRNKVHVARVDMPAPTSGSLSKADAPAQDRRELPQSKSAKAHGRGAHSMSEKEPSFLALPAFALAMPDEDLRLVRVEMPLSSLRLLGARVNDEFITKTVVADLLVGPDGTPYAFRLVA